MAGLIADELERLLDERQLLELRLLGGLALRRRGRPTALGRHGSDQQQRARRGGRRNIGLRGCVKRGLQANYRL